ncbi:histidine phosphatase family protein [Streptomyces sp. NPDC051940]|uniref:histidine phosphatase family protein n=1 Tax=Streptomyces sp. NPDC051940 TaxID=3155675 RepID=UPI003429A680
MTRRVTLVAPAMSGETRAAAFGADGTLDEAGRKAAREAGAPNADRVWCAPAVRCQATAAALRLNAEVVDELADWNVGTWRGRTLEEVAAEHPDDVRAWLADPGAAPHGGEPLTGLLARAGGWLDGAPGGRTVVVADPAVIRAAVVSSLGLPAAAFWRLDVVPLSATQLTGRAGRWNLRLGTPLTKRRG